MTDRIESCDLTLSSADTDALHDADSRWRARFGSASRRELLRRFAAEFESGGLSAALLCARLEQRHVWRHGLAALAAELADERERDAAAVSDAALVTYERKWSKRLARLQRMNPARWAVRELSAEELHAELTLRLLDALRSGEREFSRDERVGREWGLSFLARQRAALRERFRLDVSLVEEPVCAAPCTQEDALIDAQSERLFELARERAESTLSRPQRLWLSAMRLSANAGGFFESSGKLNLAAASRLLDKNRSSAQRAFAELQNRFSAELSKLDE
jgi:hypothetical protein